LFNHPLSERTTPWQEIKREKLKNYAKRKEKKETQNGYSQTQKAFEKKQT
jgi:hypothetical protein